MTDASAHPCDVLRRLWFTVFVAILLAGTGCGGCDSDPEPEAVVTRPTRAQVPFTPAGPEFEGARACVLSLANAGKTAGTFACAGFRDVRLAADGASILDARGKALVRHKGTSTELDFDADSAVDAYAVQPFRGRPESGQLRFIDCSAAQQAQIREAFAKATVKGLECLREGNPVLGYDLTATIGSSTIDFTCTDASGTTDCGAEQADVCGETIGKGIGIYLNVGRHGAGTPCGTLEATIFHELLHRLVPTVANVHEGSAEPKNDQVWACEEWCMKKADDPSRTEATRRCCFGTLTTCNAPPDLPAVEGIVATAVHMTETRSHQSFVDPPKGSDTCKVDKKSSSTASQQYRCVNTIRLAAGKVFHRVDCSLSRVHSLVDEKLFVCSFSPPRCTTVPTETNTYSEGRCTDEIEVGSASAFVTRSCEPVLTVDVEGFVPGNSPCKGDPEQKTSYKPHCFRDLVSLPRRTVDKDLDGTAGSRTFPGLPCPSADTCKFEEKLIWSFF